MTSTPVQVHDTQQEREPKLLCVSPLSDAVSHFDIAQESLMAKKTGPKRRLRRAGVIPPMPTARSAFEAFLMRQPPAKLRLPLAHTTDGWTFRALSGDPCAALKPAHCPHFGEERLYLFYGKPGYKPHPRARATSMPAFAPICFILRECAVKPAVVYPFDSGAMKNGVYADFMHPEMTCEDFAMAGDLQSASRLVAFFFGDALNYFSGYPKRELDIPDAEFEASHYYQLTSSRIQTDADHRRAIIECQFGEAMPLTSNNVEAIVMPRSLLDSPEISAFARKLTRNIIDYQVYHVNPADMAQVILDRVLGYYQQRGVV